MTFPVSLPLYNTDAWETYCCVYDPGERQDGCHYDYYPLAEVPLNQKALSALIVTRRRCSFVQQVDCVTLIENP